MHSVRFYSFPTLFFLSSLSPSFSRFNFRSRHTVRLFAQKTGWKCLFSFVTVAIGLLVVFVVSQRLGRWRVHAAHLAYAYKCTRMQRMWPAVSKGVTYSRWPNRILVSAPIKYIQLRCQWSEFWYGWFTNDVVLVRCFFSISRCRRLWWQFLWTGFWNNLVAWLSKRWVNRIYHMSENYMINSDFFCLVRLR